MLLAIQIFILLCTAFPLLMFIIGACMCDNAGNSYANIREKEKYDCFGQLQPKVVNEIIYTLNCLCVSLDDNDKCRKLAIHFNHNIYTKLAKYAELYLILSEWSSDRYTVNMNINKESVNYNFIYLMSCVSDNMDDENEKDLYTRYMRMYMFDLSAYYLDRSVHKTNMELNSYLYSGNDMDYYDMYKKHMQELIIKHKKKILKKKR